jgi:hypothetical protein
MARRLNEEAAAGRAAAPVRTRSDLVIGESPGRISYDLDVADTIRGNIFGIPSRDFPKVVGVNTSENTSLESIFVFLHNDLLALYPGSRALNC